MNKKLFLGMGTIASVVAPIVAVVSCGDEDTTTHTGNSTKGSDSTDTNIWNAPVTEEVTNQGHTFTISNELQTGTIDYAAIKAADKLDAIRHMTLLTRTLAAHFVENVFTELDPEHQSPQVYTILKVEKEYNTMVESFKHWSAEEKVNHMATLNGIYKEISDLNRDLTAKLKAQGI